MKNRMGGFEENSPHKQEIGMDGPKNTIEKNKEMYAKPIIKVVKFSVETGFGGSDSGGDGRGNGDQPGGFNGNKTDDGETPEAFYYNIGRR